MGHRAEAEDEPLEQEETTDQHQQPEHQGERREQRATAQSVWMASHLSSPPSNRRWHRCAACCAEPPRPARTAPPAVPADRKSTRRTPVTNAQLVCRLLLEKNKKQ